MSDSLFRHTLNQFLLALCLCLTSTSAVARYEVTDSFGKHTFDSPPKRVVVTDWALLEQLLELGIEPIGAPQTNLYKQYVVRPALPSKINDIGLRRSPNLDAIRALKPDVIIIGTDQKKLAKPLSRISRVLFYKSFSDKYRTNGKKSETRFLQISELFQQKQFAQEKLAARDAKISIIKDNIHHHFNHNVPPVTIIRFSAKDKALVYGKNSIVSHTLSMLDIQAAIPSKRTKWGEKEIKVDELANINDGLLLYLTPVTDKAALESKAWLSLSLVKQSKVAAMAPTWSYGGAMSVLYNAEAIYDSLLNIKH